MTSLRGLLVLRSGHALYAVPAHLAVPGIDHAAIAAAAVALRDLDTVLWWHHDGTDLRPGTSEGGARPELAVRVVTPISVDGRLLGLICRETATGALGWLPWRLASWIGAPDPRLADALAALRSVPVVRNRSSSRWWTGLRPSGSNG